ncbi:tyrosine-type recombinase/integrase [Rhizobium sp. Leaf453]|uniref:tyrosine-type recombinase/integrase n=1 Tax=Rhizobium sp. Leaf453 TaxID=1736380 RepID=UPI0007136DB8|nr:site-specific integrase [Rhizobium sp. Leaf453]KQU01600.1 recombinase XerC [Rhizobium sp. Leaf453]
MRKHHPKNERIKRRYFDYLKEAKRMDVSSVDIAAAAISGFERWSNHRDFASFHIELAKGFKAFIAKQRNDKTGKPLAKATIHSRLMQLKNFVHWLAGQPGYRSRIAYADSDYFNPSANDSRIATARREKRVPTVEQVKLVLSKMPVGSDVEKRDRAIVAFTLLTGARDSAIASFKLKHIELLERRVDQDAREVRTKNRKTFTTVFFPVGDEVEAIFADWMGHLKSALLFGPDDPLFPATKVALSNSGLFGAAGLSREHWKDAGAIRRIFKSAFEAAGLPYSNPHCLRDTLAALGMRICPNTEAMKAWSQNLGHESMLTTLSSYGMVATNRQAEIIAALKDEPEGRTGNEIEQIAALVESLRKRA